MDNKKIPNLQLSANDHEPDNQSEKYKGPETPFIVVRNIPVKLPKQLLKDILCIKDYETWIDIFDDDFLEYLGFSGANKRKHFNNRRHFWPHETEIIFKRFGVKIEELEEDE